MAQTVPVYLEIGSKRTFAGAIDWPGWCRSGRGEDEALATLVAYGRRYARAVDGSVQQFEPPPDVTALEVVERLPGNSGTDFGAPSIPPTSDQAAPDSAELERLISLHQAAWRAFDVAAEAAVGLELRKGPRGGGRDLDRMVAHVLEAEQAYLREVGGSLRREPGAGTQAQMEAFRNAAIATLRARAGGWEPPLGPRRKRPFWSLRFFVRYSAWHVLDHAWEIEDRVIR